MDSRPPHQTTIVLDGQLVFDSKFSSGNLLRAQKGNSNGDTFNLWIGNDHEKSCYRTWFFFSVEGCQSSSPVLFTIKNMSNQSMLIKDGMLPVYRIDSEQQWRKLRFPILASSIVQARVTQVNTENGLEFTFRHQFESKQKVFFAFTNPWTLEQNSQLLKQIKAVCEERKILFEQTVLTYSTLALPVELVTLTFVGPEEHSPRKRLLEQKKVWEGNQKAEEGIFPKGNPAKYFSGKQGVFISARVHPGELPSSHVMNGILKFLVSKDPIANLLLEKCVFYIVPIINPDGVDRGLYRSDSLGQNLNRHYTNPTPSQPEIMGIKQFLCSRIGSGRIQFCLDLHAHAGKKGCFIYGNYAPDFNKQLDICLFPKLLAVNSCFFDYDACNFSERNMYSVDKGDTQSKEGAARVAIFKDTGLHTCWTLECNYNSGRMTGKDFERGVPTEKFNINAVSRKVVMEDPLLPLSNNTSDSYTTGTFEDVGKGICEALADYYELTPNLSKVNTSPFKNIKTLRLNVAVCLLRMLPFRYEASIRKILSHLLTEQKVFEALVTLSRLIETGKPAELTPLPIKSLAPKPPKLIPPTSGIVSTSKVTKDRRSSVRAASISNLATRRISAQKPRSKN